MDEARWPDVTKALRAYAVTKAKTSATTPAETKEI
jgi:hypothetical protein